MPLIWLEPVDMNDLSYVEKIFNCPVYKTPLRRGELSTTGHSTNFIMYLDLPIGNRYTKDHWLRRGTALILSTEN